MYIFHLTRKWYTIFKVILSIYMIASSAWASLRTLSLPNCVHLSGYIVYYTNSPIHPAIRSIMFKIFYVPVNVLGAENTKEHTIDTGCFAVSLRNWNNGTQSLSAPQDSNFHQHSTGPINYEHNFSEKSPTAEVKNIYIMHHIGND